MRHLVRAYASAGSRADRLRSLEAILGHVGVPVMDADTGHWVVRTGPAAVKDTALYVHEIAGLDWAFRAHRAVPLDEVAQVINDAGYAAADLRVTPAALQHALVQAASLSRTRASGGDRAFTSSRVVPQLGGLDPRDPARMRAARITSLDPVQALLVVEDFTLPVYAAPGPQARHVARSALPTLTHGMVSFDGRWLRSAHTCEKYKPLLKWAAGGFGSLVTSWVVKNVEIAKPVIGSVVGGSKKAGGWLSKSIKGVVVAKVILDAAHALAVGITVDLEYVRPPMPIKLGSAPVRFGAHVEQLYQWPKDLVKCGYLAGLHLPDKGPVPDIEVFWWSGRLGDFGTLTPAASSQVSAGKTGADGWSWLTFAPNPDPARSGSLAAEHGTAWALPSVNGSLQGGGAWLQNHAIDFFRINAMQWAVEYHLPTHLSVNMSLVEDYGWENS